MDVLNLGIDVRPTNPEFDTQSDYILCGSNEVG